MYFSKKSNFIYYWIKEINYLGFYQNSLLTNKKENTISFLSRKKIISNSLFSKSSLFYKNIYNHDLLIQNKKTKLSNVTVLINKKIENKLKNNKDLLNINSLTNKNEFKNLYKIEAHHLEHSVMILSRNQNKLSLNSEIFPQNKQWYSYWLLPFVGFILTLPSFFEEYIPNQKSNYYYGFKYLNNYLYNKSSTSQTLINPNKEVKSENLMNSYFKTFNINKHNFFNSPYLKLQISDNINISNKRFIKNSILNSKTLINKNAFYTKSARKMYVDYINFNNFSKPISQNILLSNKNLTIENYKKYDLIINSLIKNLFYLKDETYENTFYLLNNIKDLSQITNNNNLRFLTELFKSSSQLGLGKEPLNKKVFHEETLENALFYSKKGESAFLMNNMKEESYNNQIISNTNLHRFLESYEDSLYFYNYIINHLTDSMLSKFKFQSLSNDLNNINNIYDNLKNSNNSLNQFNFILNIKNPELISYKRLNKHENTNLEKKVDTKSQFNQISRNINSYLSYITSKNDFTTNNSSINIPYNQSNINNISKPKYSELSNKTNKYKISNYLNFLQLELAKSFKIKSFFFDYICKLNKTTLKSQKILNHHQKVYNFRYFSKNEEGTSSYRIKFFLPLKRKLNIRLKEKDKNWSINKSIVNKYALVKNHSSLLSNVTTNEQIFRNFIISKQLNITNLDKKVNTIKNLNLKILISKLQKKIYLSKTGVNKVLLNNKKTKLNLTNNSKIYQPIDFLRIKHFIFLNNFEKNELKIFKNINNILKDEKLLYEINNRESLIQKRRKKKRKRWTRRRRKRKRKLLRPLWITLNLVNNYYTKRTLLSERKKQFNNSLIGGNKIFLKNCQQKEKVLLIKNIKLINNYSFSKKENLNSILELNNPSMFYSSKDLYLLSKKVLSELSNMKKYRNTSKKILSNLQKLNIKKTKYFINQKIKNILGLSLFNNSLLKYKIDINKKLFNNNKLLEYNRIMYERLQNFIINSSYDQLTKNTNINTSSILQRTNLSRIKLTQTVPKEEWMWLFKYITGELPREPVLSNQDILRSIWATGKSNYINQWTGWKNFYYQEFKKGLTPNYELWQDKKPDKRYNVNNLKKRHYKQSKKIQRLRVFPQFSRGSYFSLNRDLNKLNSLGINKNNNNISNLKIGRPIDKLRKTLKDLKIKSNNKFFVYNELNLNTINTTSSYFVENSTKPIMDTYKNWWENTLQTSWGWKTLQYGAPWDRKTLYLPTQFSNNNLITLNSINIKSYNEQNTINEFYRSDKLFQTTIINNKINFKFLLLSTLLLHICAFLALVSLSELRYTIKVNMIILYKISIIPWKIASSIVDPLFIKNSKKSSFDFTRIKPIIDQSPFNNLKDQCKLFDKKVKVYQNLNRNFIKKILVNKINDFIFYDKIKKSINLVDISNISYVKIGFYSILKQILKQEIRYNNINNKNISNLLIKNKTSFVNKNKVFPSSKLRFDKEKVSLFINENLTLNSLKLANSSISFGFKTYYTSLQLIEIFIDSLREFTRSIYDFFSLPENFSPNPDEVGLDVLANFIYDFEEPLNELLPDALETQIDKYINRFILTLSIFGPIGLLVQQRINWFYRIFVDIIYKADADYLNDEQELYILYTVWADILNKAAEELDLEASVIASQEDQRVNLLDYLVNTSILDTKEGNKSFKNYYKQIINSNYNLNKDLTKLYFEKINISDFLYKTNNDQSINNWLVDQYVLYKTDETDLFLEINSPKSFSHVRGIKYYDILQQPLGNIVCQMYSGIFSKQMAKNLLIITDQITDKSSIIQALAGETELKLILDNSSRYASISQNVAVGMRMLRDVFDAIALQTPCIFVLEDIHLIGEKRPFLISDEDLALVTNSGLGLEQHQLYEKNQKIQQNSKHRISYFKKAYRGEASDSLPTNLLCYDLFLNQLEQTELRSNTYPISIDFHRELDVLESSGITNSQKLLRSSLKELNDTQNKLKIPNSHLTINETFINSENPINKVSHLVNELDWSTKNDETFGQKSSLFSLRHKVSTLADQSLSNISLKLDRITQLLVIMDNVRKNKGFIVFGTTNKPQLLDPALRRPGRLEETISLPSIPNLLSKWEILITNISITSNNLSNKYTFDLFQTSLLNTQLDLFFKQSSKGAFTEYKNLLYSYETNIVHDNFIKFKDNLIFSSNKKHNWFKLLEISKNHLNYKKSISFKKNNLKILLFKIGSSKKLSVKHKNKLLNYCNLKQRFDKKYSFSSAICKNLVIGEDSLISEITLTTYEKIGKLLIEIMYDQKIFDLINLEMNLNTTIENSSYSNLYSSKELFKSDLIKLFAGLVSNFLGNSVISNNFNMNNFFPKTMLYQKDQLQKRLTLGNYSTKTTIEWKLATKLIYSYIQKRAIYNKNRYIYKLFNMNQSSTNSYPSPPITSLLLPAKRYENYLKAQRDIEQTNISGITLSIQEKIESHLSQRVLKRLYKLPIKEFYKSEIIENSLTNFSSSTLTLPFDSFNFAKHNKQSKSNFYYRNIFIKRHRQYLINQWWNAHLTEYNIETTVMSEIDFRSIVFGNNELRETNYNRNNNSMINNINDLLIDFPDPDQHYNPKQRRWYIHSHSWKTWSDLEKGLTTDIMSHYIFETFSTTYQLLDKNRELLDNLVCKLMKNSQIQEIETIQQLS